MGYEKDVLARARQRHQADVEAFRSLRRQLREEILQELPQAAAMDSELRSNMAEVLCQCLRYGEDPTEKIRRVKARNQSIQAELQELLLENDYPMDALDEKRLCPKCADTGYIGASMCACLRRYCKEEQTRALTSLLGAQASFDDFNLDYYPDAVDPNTGMSPREIMEQTYNQCVEYAMHFAPGKSGSLLFNGPPGLGKTFLSACIAREVVDRGCSVVYDTAVHLFSCMERQKFGGATEEDNRMVDRMSGCDLLILDDLGTEMASAFTTTALYTVVNGRLLSGMSTIISTNLSLSELSRRYSPAIASRLAGEYTIYSFRGNDIRRLRKREG